MQLIYAIVRSSVGAPPYAVSTIIDTEGCELHDLGNGYRVYLIEIPCSNGKTAVVCSRTGGVFGGSLEHVSSELKKYDIRDTSTRIKNSLATAQAAQCMEIDQFWAHVLDSLKVDV